MSDFARKIGSDGIDFAAENIIDSDTVAYAVEGFPYPDVPCDWDYSEYEDEIFDEVVGKINTEDFGDKFSDLVNDCLYDAIRDVYKRRVD